VAATNTVPPLHCAICSHPLEAGQRCGNPVCNWGDRHIRRVDAICLKTGAVDRIIRGFKYGTAGLGWRVIFGRLVLGWLEANRAPGDYDLIIVNPPTHPSRAVRHTELILDAAHNEDLLDLWPFDREPRALIKVTETPPSASQKWKDKKIAADALQDALRILDPARMAGKRILVVDDITTTLLQLNVIAGVLRAAGHARVVDGLVLARSIKRQ
jgi:predicted amidophosphoribosyltransferase